MGDDSKVRRALCDVLIWLWPAVDDLLYAVSNVLVGPPHVWGTLTELVEKVLWGQDRARMRLR